VHVAVAIAAGENYNSKFHMPAKIRKKGNEDEDEVEVKV
jgi:hypothetical protein